MIVLVALLFRLFVRSRVIDNARVHGRDAAAGSIEGHAAMDMSVHEQGSFRSRLFSGPGFTAVSQGFVMEWAAILQDLLIGLLIAGAIGAWVPDSFWSGFFLTDDPTLSVIWGPIISPIVGILSFVCSVGNVPLAAVLWGGGISFGGVVAFLFADLLILPILNIYRRYYEVKMMLVLLGTFYVSMVAAGYAVEGLFWVTGLTPQDRSTAARETGISWNYTTWLNIGFLLLAAVLLVRFARTGGIPMLKMMGGDPEQASPQSASTE